MDTDDSRPSTNANSLGYGSINPRFNAQLRSSIEMLKQLGDRLSHEFAVNGKFVPAILAAFVARVISLEDFSTASSLGRPCAFDIEHSNLSQKAILELTLQTRERVSRQRDAEFETLSMQVTFESLYANELHRIRMKQTELEDSNQRQLQKIVELGTNISSQEQVGQLYRAVFRLLRSNSFVEAGNVTDTVNRELAATLESVFPQSSLNAFNLMGADEKAAHVAELVNIVLGIRVFNLAIGKGGAGLLNLPSVITSDTDALFSRLELECNQMLETCHNYESLLNFEYERPGSISSSCKLLQDELTNRRQFVQLVSQLQHEVLASMDKIRAGTQIYARTTRELQDLVGQKDSVPKEEVYPRFNILADTWQALLKEREQTLMRGLLLNSLLQYKDNIDCSYQSEDQETMRRGAKMPLNVAVASESEAAQLPAAGDPNPDEFVQTLLPPDQQVEVDNAAASAPSPSAAAAAGAESQKANFVAIAKGNLSVAKSDSTADAKPVRLVRECAPDFMALPLEYEGFCPWTVVHRAGLVLPGDPTLGLIRFSNKYFSFCSYAAMRDFVGNPLKYIDGVVTWARRRPVLIHLLTLQDQIVLSDIAQLFTLSTLHDVRLHADMVAADKGTTATQTEEEREPAPPGEKYEWNQWELRREAIKLANLTSKITRSTQTTQSVFRTEKTSQVYVARDQSTMTAVDKGTNVARVQIHQTGIRGAPTCSLAVVALTHTDVVMEGSNLPLKNNQRMGIYGDKHSRKLMIKTPNVLN